MPLIAKKLFRASNILSDPSTPLPPHTEANGAARKPRNKLPTCPLVSYTKLPIGIQACGKMH
jgi:hypothetical protein